MESVVGTLAAMPPDSNDDSVVPGLTLKGGDADWMAYAGKVVAIVEGEVRAFGETWADCFAAADKLGLADPTFMFVPTGSYVG